jgi:hypothetical protein
MISRTKGHYHAARTAKGQPGQSVDAGGQNVADAPVLQVVITGHTRVRPRSPSLRKLQQLEVPGSDAGFRLHTLGDRVVEAAPYLGSGCSGREPTHAVMEKIRTSSLVLCSDAVQFGQLVFGDR